MEIFKSFMEAYGNQLLFAALTAIAGYVGIAIKRLYAKYVNDKTKKDVVKTCVTAVEQIYKDLHGEEKLGKALEYAADILTEKGITTSKTELQMMVESVLAEFNKVFDNGGDSTAETT